MKTEVSIFVSGDFCPIGRVEQKILSKDTDGFFGDLESIISEADLSVTNLECPLTDSEEPLRKTGPAIKGPRASAGFLKKSGIDIVTLANNHILDYDQKGLADTIEVLEENELLYVGAGETGDKARKTVYLEIEDLKVAILNFAENEWSTTHDERGGANPIEPISNFKKIQSARNQSDKVIVISHGGHELSSLPTVRMKNLFHFYIDAGADAVINHHPHYISGYEIYKECPIFYSLGNFVFDSETFRNTRWNIGLAVVLKMDKSSLKFELVLFEQCKTKCGVDTLSKEEAAETFDYIKNLNNIIRSDNSLERNFSDFVETRRRIYSAYLEPFNNKYLLGLQNRHLIPRLFNRRNRLLLQNLIRCESHRELLIQLLRNEDSRSS